MHKFTRPVRYDRLDIVDGAIIGYAGLLLIIGILIGSTLPEILYGSLQTQVTCGAIVFLTYIAAFFMSCSLSKKYIVDSDETCRDERNLAVHRIAAGPMPLVLLPLLVGAAVFLLAR